MRIKGELPGNTLDKNLKAPANLAAPEDGLTPTSIKLTWDKVEGATAYDIEELMAWSTTSRVAIPSSST